MNINLTLFGEMITFLIFAVFTMKFVWPLLLKAIDERREKIADGIAAAERSQKELAQTEQLVAKQLRESKEHAQTILEQAEKRATQIIEEARVQAKEESQRIIGGAQAEIEREVEASKQVLRAKVATLAVAGAEKLIKAHIDADKNKQLLDSLAEEI